MRKLIALLLALMMIGCTAFAEDADQLTALEFEDFTLAIRKDAVGTGTDTIESGVPFLIIYQNYDPNALVGKNLSVVWNEEVMDLTNLNPAAYAQAIGNATAQRYEAVGIAVTNPVMYTAELDMMDDKVAVSFIFSMDLDFSALGLDQQATVYTMQATVPIKGKGTYMFTISTDDLENSQELLDIVDSVRWKD